MHVLEEQTGRLFGAVDNPLVVSVRSGAPVSMPGMMDTILNMGVTDSTVAGLAGMMGDERPALDAFRRLIQGFGDVVLGIPKARFETTLEAAKKRAGAEFDYELQPGALRELISEFKGIIEETTGEPLSDDPWVLLRAAVEAVFNSWNNPRAITYREFQGISHNMGTACVIMAMVFGNLGDDSGTGVLFSRNPGSGERGLYGEFLPNAQGEDVVAGYARPNASRPCAPRGRRSTGRLKRLRASSRRTTRTCRTSSSRWSEGSCSSCRPAPRSGRRRQRCG